MNDSMEIKYTVFWLDKARRIYGDDEYYVLGEWMQSFDTEQEAEQYIEKLNPKTGVCTILKTFSRKKP